MSDIDVDKYLEEHPCPPQRLFMSDRRWWEKVVEPWRESLPPEVRDEAVRRSRERSMAEQRERFDNERLNGWG